MMDSTEFATTPFKQVSGLEQWRQIEIDEIAYKHKNIFTVRKVKQWNKYSQEVVDSLSFDTKQDSSW